MTDNTEKKTLTLHVKQKWFNRIRTGRKNEEYRIKSPYWISRLQGKKYDYVEICFGYPRSDEVEKRLMFKCFGITTRLVVHSEFGPSPVWVFVIHLDEKV